MAEEKIDSYVDRNGVKGDTDFILSSLREVYGEFQKLQAVKVDMKGLSGLSDMAPMFQKATAGADSLAAATREVEQRMAQMNGKSKEFTQVLALQTRAQKDAAQANLLSAKAANEAAKAKQNENKATEQSEKAKSREKKMAEDATNMYLQLSKQYNDAARKAKDYFIRLGEGHPLTVQAVKDANDMATVLKKADASVGQFQRNVGNYASAFNGLGMSFAQVARELPSLTISVQQFALAISNNLPMVADQLALAKKEIAALKAEGKDAPSLFSKISSSLISWQVGLSVGIALLTAYAGKIKDWISSLFSGDGALDQVRESQSRLNSTMIESNGEYVKAVALVTDLKTKLMLAKAGFVDKEKAVKYYNETIGQTTGEVKSLNEAEAALARNSAAYIKFTLLKAAANTALNEASKLTVDLAKEQLDPDSRSLAVTLRAADAEAKYGAEIRASAEYQKLQREETDAFNLSLTNRTDETVRAYEKLKGAAKAYFEEQLQLKAGGVKARNAKTLQDIAQDFQTQAAKLAQEFKFNFFGIDDDKKSGKDDLAKKLKEESDKRIQIAAELRKIEIQRDIDFNKERVNNEELSLVERLQALQKYYQARIALLDVNANTEKAVGTKTAEELTLIEATRGDEQIRLDKEVYAERDRLIKEFSKQFTEEHKRMLSAAEKYIDEAYKRFAKAEEERTKKEKEEAKKREKNAEEEAAAKKRLQQQLVGELTTLAFTALSANTEREKNARQEQIDLLEEKKKKDIEVANTTIANAQERAAAISVIEARANAQKEELQRRQRDFDIRKAQFDKAQAIARIIQETATNVVKYFGTPLALLAAAIGAEQLGTVLAQQIPRYKHGKNVGDAYEGPAIVDDGGKPEAIIREDGTVEIGGNKPRLTYVKSRDIVLPDASKLADYVLSGKMGTKLAPNVTVTADTGLADVRAGLDRVVTAIKNKPELQLKAGEGGLVAIWKHGANQISYINSNTNW